MTPCRSPVPWETFVAYFAGDLGADEETELEGHLFGCAACAGEAARVASITETLRGMIPAVLTHEQLTALRDRGLRVRDTSLAPGDRREEHFPRDADLLIVHLGGLALPAGTRVSVTVRAEEDEKVLVSVPDAPFDPGSGEILLCCQRHFAALPSDIVVDVELHEAGAGAQSMRYALRHQFH